MANKKFEFDTDGFKYYHNTYVKNPINSEKSRAQSAESTLNGKVSALETAVGSGGSVDSRIAAAKAEIKGNATSACDTLGEAEALINDRYTKSETYTKTEVNGLVDTPHQNYVTVATYASLPASGSKDTIYRVSNYNGSTSQVDASVYSEYAWNGTQYIFLCVKSQIGEVFDISVYNNNAKYADLAAALNGGANIPQSLQKGGMSVKFVHSIDDKYIQFMYVGTSTAVADFTNTANWEKINLEKEINQLNQEVNGIPSVEKTGVIPIVANQVNQSPSTVYAIYIQSGTYHFTIDNSYLGEGTYIYAIISGESSYLGTLGQLNGTDVTFPSDATAIFVYANADNSLLTGNCRFSFTQDAVRGLVDDIDDLNLVGEKVDGVSKSVDVEIPLTSAAQYNVKFPVSIQAGKYWVDASPMNLLTINYINVYVYYKSAPNTQVYIGQLSSLKSDYWGEILQEITFAEEVVAISIYHLDDVTGTGTLTLSFIDQNAIPSYKEQFDRIISKTSPAFVSLSGNKTLVQDDVLVLDDVKVIKNSALFAEINGAISDVNVGVGYDSGKPTDRGYTAYWIKLKPTTVELWWNNNTDTLIDTFTHGLTLDDFTRISIIRNGNNCSLRIVTKLGAVYENNTFNWRGVGAPFIENGSSNSVNVSLNFTPQDLSKKIWVFGDSYCGIFNPARWPEQLISQGVDKFLINAQGGEAMKEAVLELANLLDTGYAPAYIVWALGMNGTGDAAGQTDASYIADYQKLWLMRFLRICIQNGITPILCTIPSVPTMNHHALSSYIRGLGYRYIDFANAVGSQVDGTWYAGLLSDDDVHPSVEGARVLSMQVLKDFPEIQID